NLNSGYPYVKAVNNTAGESLNYLFNTPSKTYYQANHLFKMLNGYYVYDSAENFAQFDTTSQEFTVYGQPNKGFFPFNNYTDNVQIEAASTDKNKVTNHHFGMHVNFTFMQPVDGKVDGKDMIFHFSGDDDVWVFIDGMLVLDLGGIHQPIGGTINYATGQVTFDEGTTGVQPTSIYDMYLAAWEEAGYTDDEITQLKQRYFVRNEAGNYVFKNYSQHKLDFFYLERGAHDTNCNIKFNLVSIPENTVSVEKEITETNMADFADATFKFRLETSALDTNSSTGSYLPRSVFANQKYQLYEISGSEKTLIEEKYTDENGEFELKHRQLAEFEGIPASTYYWVTELDVVSDEYDEVKFNGETTITNEDNQEIGDGNFSTGQLLAQECVYVKFQNKCNAENHRNLVINKVMAEGQTSDEAFRIKLEFADDSNWVPYVGTYYVGATQEEALAEEPLTTDDGIITLNAGQSAYIIGLISDTEYKVTEVLSVEQQPNFAAPLYSGTGRTTPTVDPITDVIDLEDTNTVYIATVTNTLLSKTVNVNKVWSDSDVAHEAIYVGLYKDNDGTLTPVTYKEVAADTWSTTFDSLPIAYEYDVKELVQGTREDGTYDFTIDGDKYIATDVYYSTATEDYKVGYSRTESEDTYTSTVTITNTLLSKIEVEKVWNDGNIEHTNDTVHVGLYKVTGDQKELITVQELKATTTWKTVFDKLTTSAEYTYEVKELIPGDNNSYTAVDEDGIYSNGTFEYKVSYEKDGDSKVVITNTIKDKVVVEKIWADADNANGKRPESLDIYLKDGDHTVTLTLGKDKQGKVENHVLNGKAVRAEFTTDWSVTLYGVSSSYAFEEAPVAGYVSNKVVSDDKVTFTNTFNILIFKQSATDKHALEGAIFKITQGETSYYAESMADGRLGAWYNNETLTGTPVLPDGAFTLSEIKAPAGYMLSEAEWNIQMVNGLIVKVDGADTALVEMINANREIEAYTMSFVNEALYELPSTGGLGIYVPMMSGVIMMMAAAFILMNNKR
ncbi:MAG: Cna B-type domain-containing protein, partial [Erysipelotrichaceae bacterium]|nr:Cna B-type domain-containing protein [Erysipelotrichaceae bacterium]